MKMKLSNNVDSGVWEAALLFNHSIMDYTHTDAIRNSISRVGQKMHGTIEKGRPMKMWFDKVMECTKLKIMKK